MQDTENLDLPQALAHGAPAHAPKTDFNPLVSYFPDAYENLPTDIPAAQFIASIKSNQHKKLVAQIRERFQRAIGRGVDYSKAKRAVDSQKKKLPAVSFAGVLPMRDKNVTPQFTGLLQADLDLLGDRILGIRVTIRDDPHVYALFLSPTGEGLKAIFRVPLCKNEAEYKMAFAAMSAHVQDLTGVEIDELEDFTRLCFASHDPDAYLNPNAIQLPVDFSQTTEETKPPPVKPATTAAVESRRAIAELNLGNIEWQTDVMGFCRCPGEPLHTNGNAPKDCRVTLDGSPTIYCLHKSCRSAVEMANRNLRSQIGKAEWTPPADHPGSTTPDVDDHFKSDTGYADAFVKRHADSIRYCADEKTWLVFGDVSGWQRDNTGKIKSMAADYARELYRLALKTAADMDPDSGKRLISNMATLGNVNRINAALSLAACNPSIVVLAPQLDADPFLVGVQNGVINLVDGSFQSHHRAHLVTRRLAVSYDANAAAPTWDKFLREVQPEAEMRNFLQRLCGYALSGEIREHVLPFHYGTGANGKGTFLEHGLLKLAGNYGAKLTDNLVYASKKGIPPHLEIANLCGTRFALGEENSESGELNEALLKSITGGDRQKGRFHYGNFVEYFPTYKIALVGNHKPRIDGTDDGIWRRFLLVDWKIQIPEEKRDLNLKEKLAAEMPGILNWCIEGARAWRANGLNPPAACKAATAAFREKSDVLNEFIAECFEADNEVYCTKADVFAAYQRWAGQQGVQRPMSKRALGFQLINRGWQEFKQGHENSHCWAGFRLKI